MKMYSKDFINLVIIIKQSQMANLLQINPYTNKFFDIAAENLLNAFAKQTPENIQIEFKYAVLTHPLFHLNERQLKDIPPKERARTEYLLERQANQFLSTLQLVSAQSVINLNPIGKQICNVTSGFNQFQHKKLYHMRDLFIKLGIFNQYVNFKRVEPINRPFNIYQELSLHNYNHTFHVNHQSEIRLDLYLKDPVSTQLQGRYSYTAEDLWKKAKKQPLCPQLDYLFSGQIFRFAVNRQKENKVSQADIQQISRVIKSTRKAFDIRLKRQTIIRKAHHFQITISQIYNISDVQVCQDIAFYMVYPDAKPEFDRYIRKLFINFYSCMQREKQTLRFQIELQITKIWNQKYKDLLQARKFQEVRNELNTVMEELLAMYYADHTTKVKEQNWMNYLVPNQMEQARLQNQFGGYMRQRIYKQMERGMRPQMRK